jgi:small-conductance mechanosensitive channel
MEPLEAVTEPVEDIVAPEAVAPQDAQEIALDLVDQGATFLTRLMRPWNSYQVAIVIGLIIVAYIIGYFVAPKLHAWMRSREGWPKWRMRFLVLLHRRIRLIIFVLLSWITVAIMREVTWPSRSYLISVVADLALAWLVIAILSRIINNRFLRTIVRYGGWIWVTVSTLGFSEEVRQLLDSAAIDVGESHLSLWVVLQTVVILGTMFAVARFFSRVGAASVRNNPDISPSMQVLVVKFMQVTLYGVAFFLGLQVVGFDLTGLAFLSGAIGLGLGFGLQKVVSNLVSGVIILLDKSIKPGDVISLGETFGWINTLGARYASVVTRDGREYLIPNEDLISNQVVNWSHSNDFVRLDIFFGTAYGDDPHKVRAIARGAAASVDRVLDIKAPVCHIVGFGDSSVDYILRFWIKDPTGGLTNIRGNVYLALWDAFKENDISIPFPQREVKILEGEGA